MARSDLTIRNAKSGEKQPKLYDGGGLLLVTPSGSKRWIFKYRFAGKDKSLALGVYKDVPLADAREKLAANIDPSEAKKADKCAARLAASNSFEAIALTWIEERAQSVEIGQYEKTLVRFKNDALPWLGKRLVAKIDAPEILAVLKRGGARLFLLAVFSGHNRVEGLHQKRRAPSWLLPSATREPTNLPQV
ncbi:hypothetical protein CI15_14030 [Paraburkholderia monticola]|uniref:Uncharacterized protein n=1 Tax=Paraburkholderia monticola TaxID=1399968 RepID=A0A149PRX9_9BURK|nr:hypothetical protein CI15_14030 [Paraburkholderia monticola]